MEFDRNQKLIALVIALVAGVALYAIFSHDNTSSNLQKKMDIVKKDDVSTFYVNDSYKDDKKNSSEVVTNDEKSADADSNTQNDNEEESQKSSDIENQAQPQLSDLYDDSEKIKQYIEKRHLVNLREDSISEPVDRQSRYSVYADISTKDALQNRDDTLPPMAPVIINGSFASGTPYTVIIDSSVKQQAKEIVVTDNNPDGTIHEAVKIPQTTDDNTQEMSITAPPAMGE